MKTIIFIIILIFSLNLYPYDASDSVVCYGKTDKEINECFEDIYDYEVLQQDGENSFKNKKFHDCLTKNIEDDFSNCSI